MKTVLLTTAAIAVVLVSSAASAQSTPDPAPAPLPETSASPAAAAAPAAPAAPTEPAAPPPLSVASGSREDVAVPAEVDRPTVGSEEGPHPGFAMSVQTGYAIPLGKIGEDGSAISDGFTGQVPIWIEIGGNVTPSVFLGVYGAYSLGGVTGELADACAKDHGDCAAHSVRGGIAVRYRFQPGESVQPWIGYGVGYESLTLSESVGALSGTGSFTGWEYAHFSGGVDFKIASSFTLGPAIDFALGEYNHVHFEGTGVTTRDADIPNTSMHQWVTLGIRATAMP